MVNLGPGSPLIAFAFHCLSTVLPVLTRLISNPCCLFDEGDTLSFLMKAAEKTSLDLPKERRFLVYKEKEKQNS